MDYTKSCHTCWERMPAHQRARAPLKERPIAEKPFERVEIDIKGSLPRNDKRSQFILVIQDAFFKYVELCPLQRQATEEVSCKIQEWIARYGLPEVVHSDNGTCFRSRAFEQFGSQHGIRHTKSMAYHPQANGAVECFDRTLEEMLATAMDSNDTT